MIFFFYLNIFYSTLGQQLQCYIESVLIGTITQTSGYTKSVLMQLLLKCLVGYNTKVWYYNNYYVFIIWIHTIFIFDMKARWYKTIWYFQAIQTYPESMFYRPWKKAYMMTGAQCGTETDLLPGSKRPHSLTIQAYSGECMMEQSIIQAMVNLSCENTWLDKHIIQSILKLIMEIIWHQIHHSNNAETFVVIHITSKRISQ